MNIIGPDALVFGVGDLAACSQYLADYGLKPVATDERGKRFEALDGTAIALLHKDDTMLPPSLGTAGMLRKTMYGVVDLHLPGHADVFTGPIAHIRTIHFTDHPPLLTVSKHCTRQR